MILDYPNLYYDLTGRCALRTSLGRFSLKIKITMTQTTTENHGMPGIHIHSNPGDKGSWFSPPISFILPKPPNSEEDNIFFFFLKSHFSNISLGHWLNFFERKSTKAVT